MDDWRYLISRLSIAGWVEPVPDLFLLVNFAESIHTLFCGSVCLLSTYTSMGISIKIHLQYVNIQYIVVYTVYNYILDCIYIYMPLYIYIYTCHLEG